MSRFLRMVTITETKKYVWTLISIVLMVSVVKSNAFGAMKDISELEKNKLNLYKGEVVKDSVYENVKDYTTQVSYIEIIEVNKSNIKERIPIIYKKATARILVDKERERIILRQPLLNKKGKGIELLNKGKTKMVFVKYTTKFNDGRFPAETEKTDVFEAIPSKIVGYKEYVPPSRYFSGSDVENFKSYGFLDLFLSGLSGNGEIEIKIDSTEFKNQNVKIKINQTKVLEFSERTVDLTKYGDLKKIQERSGYKLPEELVVKTTVYITNYGFRSIFGGRLNAHQ